MLTKLIYWLKSYVFLKSFHCRDLRYIFFNKICLFQTFSWSFAFCDTISLGLLIDLNVLKFRQLISFSHYIIFLALYSFHFLASRFVDTYNFKCLCYGTLSLYIKNVNSYPVQNLISCISSFYNSTPFHFTYFVSISWNFVQFSWT